jgi:hypothetical protein
LKYTTLSARPACSPDELDRENKGAMSRPIARQHTQRALELIDEASEMSNSPKLQSLLQDIRLELEAALKAIKETQDLAAGR